MVTLQLRRQLMFKHAEGCTALSAYLHLHCVLELSNKDYLFFTRNWISSFLYRDKG